MAEVWSTVRTVPIDGDSYRIYSHALYDHLWTWWSPALSIGGQIPWEVFQDQELPLDALRTKITEYLHCNVGPA